MRYFRKEGKVVITGEHDVNKKWISELRSQPACPHQLKRDTTGGSFGRTQIVPRFLIEGWKREEFDQLFSPESTVGAEVIKAVLSVLKKYKFDGMVLDAGYINLRGPIRSGAINFLQTLGDSLKAESMLFVLVIPVRPIFCPSSPLSSRFYLLLQCLGPSKVFF